MEPNPLLISCALLDLFDLSRSKAAAICVNQKLGLYDQLLLHVGDTGYSQDFTAGLSV